MIVSGIGHTLFQGKQPANEATFDVNVGVAQDVAAFTTAVDGVDNISVTVDFYVGTVNIGEVTVTGSGFTPTATEHVTI